MGISIRLTKMDRETIFTPLGVLGYCLTRTHFLEPIFEHLTLPLKTVEHLPAAKLQDVVVSVLAGCRSIAQVNTRLRPDRALALSWQRTGFADQSSLARTLDAFGETHLEQLRQGVESWFRAHSRTYQHPFEQDYLWLDLDFTPLPISKRAEGATKGNIEGKKTSMGAS